MEMSKKGGIGKVIVWIVIILIISGALFVAYNYLSQDTDLRGDNEVGDEEISNGDPPQQTGTEQTDKEKPPMPPE